MCNYVVHATNAYAGHLLPSFAGLSEESSPRDFGIIPTRGQVAAIQASVASSRFPWRNGWASSGGWEYWFPRLQGQPSGKPLIILGGGRQFSGGNLESGTTDDRVVNARVTEALKVFLPQNFPALFNESEMESSWMMEWVIFLFDTLTFMR